MDLFLLPIFSSASLQPHRVRREPPIRSRKLRGVRKRNWAGALSFCCPGTSTSKNVATLSLGVQLRTAKNKKAKPVITNEETWAVSWNTLMLKKWNPREGNEPRSRKGPGSSVSHWALSFICPVFTVTFTNAVRFERYSHVDVCKRLQMQSTLPDTLGNLKKKKL